MHVLIVAPAHANAVADLDYARLPSVGCTASVVGFDLRGVERLRALEAPAAIVIDVRQQLQVAQPVIDRLRRVDTFAHTPVLLGIRPWHAADVRPEQGADDFIVLPAAAEEVKARVRRLERRDHPKARRLQPGALSLDAQNMSVTVRGRSVRLAPRELQVLSVLAAEVGRAFTRDELVLRGWGASPNERSRTVDIHVRWLREKLGPDGAMVETVRGVGYRLRAPA